MRQNRRGSVLAAALSGNKELVAEPDIMKFIVEDDDDKKSKVDNFRRLSTLYGVSANCVQKTKKRARKISDQPQTTAGSRPQTAPSPTLQFQPQNKNPKTKRTVLDQQDDLNSTFERLIKLKRNKKQNMEQPLVDRLSRPKSARPKFNTRRREEAERENLRPSKRPPISPEQKERDMESEVHADNKAPAWFFGRDNTVTLSTTPFAVASRFGFRGALNMAKRSSARAQHVPLKLIENPERINIERDLAQQDEWGPSLRNLPATTGYNHNTPKMWPEAAEFPTGIKFKKENEKVWYNRESTLGHTRPQSALPERLSRTLQREKNELIQIRNTINQERKTVARPSTAPSIGRGKMSNTGNFVMKMGMDVTFGGGLENSNHFGNEMMSGDDQQQQQPVNKKMFKTAIEEKEVNAVIKTNRLNYWGEMSASVKRDIRPEYARAVINRENNQQVLQSDVKWMLLSQFYSCFRRHRQANRPNNQKGPGLSDLHDLATLFQLTSADNPNPNALSRDQFVAALTKTILDDSFDARLAQKLYTTFDRKLSNRVPWVIILASIRCMLLDGESVEAKCVGIYEILDQYTPSNKLTAKNCNLIFTIVCGSEEQKHAMNTVYRHSFINFLRDSTKKRNKNSTLEIGHETVEFAKVSRQIIAEALARSKSCETGIAKEFSRQLLSVRSKSGAPMSDGRISPSAQLVQATLM